MTSQAELNDLNSYLSTGIHSVKGWCVPQLWQAIWPLRALTGNGPIAEIGVFEGKFFVGLCKTFGTSVDNKATAIDVFDLQQFNLDKAGVGKKHVLTANMSRFGFSEYTFDCLETDSLSLGQTEAAKFISDRGRVAFFSVDGCHEVIHTVSDVEFAMEVTRNDGIIAVDDYTNPDWPGVQEAIARMYLMRDFNFVPLAVTCNKLLLCSYSYHSKYLKALQSYISVHHPQTAIKSVKRFGYETLTLKPNYQVWSDLMPI